IARSTQNTANERRHRPMTDSLPILDMSGLDAHNPGAITKLAREIGAAARGIGFFYVTGHGIDPKLLRTVFEQSAHFFGLPESEKARASITRSKHNRGYVAMQGESLDPTKPADLKEAFNIGL